MSKRLLDLKSRCRRYYLEKVLKVLGVLLSLVFILAMLMRYLPELMMEEQAHMAVEQTPKPTLKQPEVSPASMVNQAQTSKAPRPYTLAVSDDALDASLDNIRKTKPAVTMAPKPQKMNVNTSVNTNPKAAHTPEPVIPAVEKKPPVRTNYFDSAEKEKPLDAWLEKFEQKKTYGVAIHIAREYYLQEEYKLSGIWAKRANQLDRNKEAAWLLYAESVYALGDVPKARRILEIYLQYKTSSKAQLLLNEWKKE